ncbi:MAG: polysaccharide synthesis protein GtrA [Parcubacteria group bacterium CG23_combo_of_CG06-09_8_20_14_all_35_9]|nr:MAG: polysaccharide synthesis protein GtrA [Parcubacteria group bacterium CG23_combo_of_CG06-09_8_20_14_all_35_9]
MNHLNKLLQKKDIKLFVGYVIFAGSATLVDFGFLYSLTEFFHIWYFYSAALAYFAGMITNYLLNKYLNFRNLSKQIISQFSLFAMVALIGLGLNQLIIYFLVEFTKLWYIYAKFISVFIVMFWSFYGHKKLTFKIFR